MIGGEPEVVQHLDPIFSPGTRSRRRAAHPGATGEPTRGTWLPALRAERRRPFRQDGPQRHRVWHHGRLCRRVQHPRHANVGAPERESMPRRRRCAIPSSIIRHSTLPEIAEVWRRGSVIAHGCSISPPPALPENPDLTRFGGQGLRFRRGALDDAGGDRRRPCRPPSSARHYSDASSSRGERVSRTSCLSAMRYEFGGHIEKTGSEGTP